MFKAGNLECLRLASAEDEPVWTPHTMHPKQKLFCALTCNEALYGGAAGGGKSDALLMAALEYVNVPKYHAIIFRRTYSDLALPGAIMQRAHEWLAGTSASWNDRDKVYRFPSGARLAFGYLDGPRDHFRYASADFQFIAFDELTQFGREQYTFLFSRLRRTRDLDVPLRMRAATNPGGIGHDWVGERFRIPETPHNDQLYEHNGRVFVPARAVDNPSLNQEEYAEMLAKLDPVTRRQLAEGHWVRDSTGLVYYAFREDRNIGDDLPELPDGEEWTRVLGCDFGVTDPTAFVELAFTEHDPTVYVTRSEQWPGMAPSDSLEEYQRWEKNAGEYDAVVGDIGGLGKGFEAEWRKRCFPMRAAQKADKLGYQKLLNGDLHHGKLVILPGNDQLVKDMRALAWKDETHAKEHPGMPNHLPDALLYGWREARHWQWEARPPPPAKGIDLAAKQVSERKERVKARIKQRQQESEQDSWDWNESNGYQQDDFY